MYRLLRRISSSFKDRFDWKREGQDNDAVSTPTPQIGSKRRMSDDDDDDVPNGSLSKRSRAHNDIDETTANELGELKSEQNENGVPSSSQETVDDSSPAPVPGRKDSEEVRQVTKGVKEVELEDKKDKGKGKETVEDNSEQFVAADSSNGDTVPSGEPEYVKSLDGEEELTGESPVDEYSASSPARLPHGSLDSASTTSDTPDVPTTTNIASKEPAGTSDVNSDSETSPANIPLPDDSEPLDDSPITTSEPEPAIPVGSSNKAVKVQG